MNIFKKNQMSYAKTLNSRLEKVDLKATTEALKLCLGTHLDITKKARALQKETTDAPKGAVAFNRHTLHAAQHHLLTALQSEANGEYVSIISELLIKESASRLDLIEHNIQYNSEELKTLLEKKRES